MWTCPLWLECAQGVTVMLPRAHSSHKGASFVAWCIRAAGGAAATVESHRPLRVVLVLDALRGRLGVPRVDEQALHGRPTSRPPPP